MDILLSYTVPCYNSAAYMDHCIQSILDGSQGFEDRIEIIIVDDGSDADDTAAKADAWAASHECISVIHQENGGHGRAVMAGLAAAQGLYFKVIDSDDWVDRDAAQAVIQDLLRFSHMEEPVDILFCNYVKEHVADGTRKEEGYTALPKKQVFTWEDVGHFPLGSYILMHTVVFRRQVLLDSGVDLPAHTFYVDDIFVYVPLPYARSMYYEPVGYYRWFIGREDQSINEKVMVGRVQQQIKVSEMCLEAYHLDTDITIEPLRTYMYSFLLMMVWLPLTLCTLSDREDREELKEDLWKHLEDFDPAMYRKIRKHPVSWMLSRKTKTGQGLSLFVYRIVRRAAKFD